MFNRLLDLYPNAISDIHPNNDPKYLWLQDEQSEQYIGIPFSELTEKEIILLTTLYNNSTKLNEYSLSENAMEWREYLVNDGPLPKQSFSSLRYIHFSISNIRDEFQYDQWEEAIRSLFSGNIIIVPIDHQNGVIIEEQSNFIVTEEDLFSAIEAFESDFFIKIQFFIGHFDELGPQIYSLFHLEQKMLKLAMLENPEDRIFSREKLIPLFIYQSIPVKDRDILFSDVKQLLDNDPQLTETIKTYIENQSNATLTAKQLFMHRNSLQYRVDKFIEKTGIDIKSFYGAFFAFLACLHVDKD